MERGTSERTPQNIKSGHGCQNQRTHKRRSSKARPGNKNAKKAPAWVSYTLDSRDNLDRFIRDMIEATWTGRLGTRQASTINAATKLLLEFRGWIPRQSQTPPDPNLLPPFTFEGVKITSTADVEAIVRKRGEEYMQKRRRELLSQHLTEKEQLILCEALAKDPQLQGEVSEWPVVKKFKTLLENDRYSQPIHLGILENMP